MLWCSNSNIPFLLYIPSQLYSPKSTTLNCRVFVSGCSRLKMVGCVDFGVMMEIYICMAAKVDYDSGFDNI